MNYADAREAIRTGDLIAIRKRGGFLPTLTRWITKSPYTHTAVAVWGGFNGIERLLVVESNSAGASLAPLSNYSDTDFDVFICPVGRAEAEAAIWELLGTKIHYDVTDLVRIAEHRLIGIPLPEQDDDALICSALSAAIYQRAGWQPWGLPSVPAPDDVVAAMNSDAMPVRVGV